MDLPTNSMQVTPQLKIHHSGQRVKMQSRLESVKVAQSLVSCV